MIRTCQISIGLISDTHGMIRDSALEALADVDTILHAGDVGSRSVYRELDAVAPIRAVRGNADEDGWGQCLAETIVEEACGHRILVLHDLDLLKSEPADEGISVVVYGHTHTPAADWERGVLNINPGTAGPAAGNRLVTVALLEISEQSIKHRFVHLSQTA